jgi:glutathione peroxidase
MRVIAAVLLLGFMMNIHAEDKMPSSVFDVTMDGIDGKPYALSKHKGEVLLIVNVASQCGYTPQYKGLQALHTKYKDKGLTVVGVPANEFGAQEPGTNDEIKAFCSTKYNVTFPVLGKTVVKGEGICPLYKYLTAQKPGDIKWNFSKFLVDRNGKVLQRYESAVKPEDAKLIEAIEGALAAKAN